MDRRRRRRGPAARARDGDGRLQQRASRRTGPASSSATRPRWRCWRPPLGSASSSTPPSASAAGARLFHFDPSLRLMSTVDEREGGLWVDTKGAPEAVLPRCRSIAADGAARPLGRGGARPGPGGRRRLREPGAAGAGGRRAWPRLGNGVPETASGGRDATSPSSGWWRCSIRPRPEVAAAVERCHRAGLRVIVDHRRPRADGGGDRPAGRDRRRAIRRSSTGERGRPDERRASSTRCCEGARS